MSLFHPNTFVLGNTRFKYLDGSDRESAQFCLRYIEASVEGSPLDSSTNMRHFFGEVLPELVGIICSRSYSGVTAECVMKLSGDPLRLAEICTEQVRRLRLLPSVGRLEKSAKSL
jgi:hypothetical protein